MLLKINDLVKSKFGTLKLSSCADLVHNPSVEPFCRRGLATVELTVFWQDFCRPLGLYLLRFCPSRVDKNEKKRTSAPTSLSSLSLCLCVCVSISVSFPIAPVQVDAVRGDSSAFTSDPQGAEGVPLIWCTECKSRQVVWHVSQKPWSAGQVFYCCPKYKVS